MVDDPDGAIFDEKWCRKIRDGGFKPLKDPYVYRVYPLMFNGDEDTLQIRTAKSLFPHSPITQ